MPSILSLPVPVSNTHVVVLRIFYGDSVVEVFVRVAMNNAIMEDRKLL